MPFWSTGSTPSQHNIDPPTKPSDDFDSRFKVRNQKIKEQYAQMEELDSRARDMNIDELLEYESLLLGVLTLIDEYQDDLELELPNDPELNSKADEYRRLYQSKMNETERNLNWVIRRENNLFKRRLGLI